MFKAWLHDRGAAISIFGTTAVDLGVAGILCDHGTSSSFLYEWENHVSKSRLF